MNFLDIILAIPLLWGIYKGFKNGLIVELATFIALILGVYGAIGFSGYTKEKMEEAFDMQSEYIGIIAFIITFIIIVIAIYLLAKLLTGITKLTPLHILNKIFGALFGLFRFAFLSSVMLFILAALDVNEVFISADTKEESVLFKPVYNLSGKLLPSINNLKENETFKEIVKEADKLISP